MRKIILHSHIFKNAGTTFDHVLERNFGKGFIDHRDDKEVLRGRGDFVKEFLRSNVDICAFSSHSIHFHIESDDEFKFFQVYFIRHPIERIRSVYRFERLQGPSISLGGKMASELNFNDYVAWRMRSDVPATIRNAHTIFLSGMGPGVGEIDVMFERAKKCIEEKAFVGVVDRFDESLAVLSSILKPHFNNIDLTYVKKNVLDKTSMSMDMKIYYIKSMLSNEVYNDVIEKNHFDLELYKLANRKLDENLCAIEDTS